MHAYAQRVLTASNRLRHRYPLMAELATGASHISHQDTMHRSTRKRVEAATGTAPRIPIPRIDAPGSGPWDLDALRVGYARADLAAAVRDAAALPAPLADLTVAYCRASLVVSIASHWAPAAVRYSCGSTGGRGLCWVGEWLVRMVCAQTTAAARGLAWCVLDPADSVWREYTTPWPTADYLAHALEDVAVCGPPVRPDRRPEIWHWSTNHSEVFSAPLLGGVSQRVLAVPGAGPVSDVQVCAHRALAFVVAHEGAYIFSANTSGEWTPLAGPIGKPGAYGAVQLSLPDAPGSSGAFLVPPHQKGALHELRVDACGTWTAVAVGVGMRAARLAENALLLLRCFPDPDEGAAAEIRSADGSTTQREPLWLFDAGVPVCHGRAWLGVQTRRPVLLFASHDSGGAAAPLPDVRLVDILLRNEGDHRPVQMAVHSDGLRVAMCVPNIGLTHIVRLATDAD